MTHSEIEQLCRRIPNLLEKLKRQENLQNCLKQPETNSRNSAAKVYKSSDLLDVRGFVYELGQTDFSRPSETAKATNLSWLPADMTPLASEK